MGLWDWLIGGMWKSLEIQPEMPLNIIMAVLVGVWKMGMPREMWAEEKVLGRFWGRADDMNAESRMRATHFCPGKEHGCLSIHPEDLVEAKVRSSELDCMTEGTFRLQCGCSSLCLSRLTVTV